MRLIKNIFGYGLSLLLFVFLFIAVIKLLLFFYELPAKPTQCAFNKIESGMTELQVTNLLGEPHSIEGTEYNKTMFFDVRDLDGISAEVSFSLGLVSSKDCVQACSCPD